MSRVVRTNDRLRSFCKSITRTPALKVLRLAGAPLRANSQRIVSRARGWRPGRHQVGEGSIAFFDGRPRRNARFGKGELIEWLEVVDADQVRVQVRHPIDVREEPRKI